MEFGLGLVYAQGVMRTPRKKFRDDVGSLAGEGYNLLLTLDGALGVSRHTAS